MTTLMDLQGRHMLDGVDFSTESIAQYDDVFEDCSVCRFRLNGTVYAAIENPSDGYRSMMRDLSVSREPIENSFPPVEVTGVYRGRREWHEDDVIDFVDVLSGKIVLSVGTTRADDYYPSFVAHFQPENLSLNTGFPHA